MRRWLYHLLPALTAIQLLLGVVLSVRGFPYYGSSLVSNAPLWESPVALAHLPGVALLAAAGLCCGFRNGLVLGPKVSAGHIRMDLAGVLILAITNWAVWLLVLTAGMGGWHLQSRRGAGGGAPLGEETHEDRRGG